MDKTHFDQAEGLRRMLHGARPRVFIFMSTLSRDEKVAMLTNLGASLISAGSSVLLLDATSGVRGTASYLDISQVATLSHVARKECALEQAVTPTPQGFCMATLARGSLKTLARNRLQRARLYDTFETLTTQFDVMMIDAQLSEDEDFILPLLPEGEIVVHVSDNPASIKAAYAIIKQMSAMDGRRHFGVLLTGASEKRTQTVYANMAKAASRYLAVSLRAIGYVPTDEHVSKAASLGKTAVEAFPRALASIAFHRLAGYFSCSKATPGGLGALFH